MWRRDYRAVRADPRPHLRILKLRKGSYFLFLEPRRMAEKPSLRSTIKGKSALQHGRASRPS